MRSLFQATILPSVLTCAVGSCASVADTPVEPAEQSASQAALDATAGAYAYFQITADLRRCAAPNCGGWFLERLNRAKTQCHDGRVADACYTPVLDWSVAGMSEGLQAKLLDACNEGAVSGAAYAIVGGWFEPTNRTTPRPDMGRFVVREAWVAEGHPVASGAFVRIMDNGLRCFAAPCPSLTEQVLNTSRTTDIAAIDWAPAGMNDDELAACVDSMYGSEGVMLAGERYMVHEGDTAAKGRTATAAYLRLTDEVKPESAR